MTLRRRARLGSFVSGSSKQDAKEHIDGLKTTTPCYFCGETDPVVKEFHHLDPTEKAFNIGNSWRSHSLPVIVAELAKCIVVCRNCHARVEAGVLEIGDDDGNAP